MFNPSFPTRFALTALAAAVSSGAGLAHAANFVVTSNASSGAGSLSEQISSANAAAGADTITFNITGTIALGSHSLPGITDDLTISGPGPGSLTIDGGGELSEGTTLRVGLAGASSVAISGLTISNSPDGALYADAGVDVAVDNVVITGTSNGNAPLVDVLEGAVLTMTGSEISDNTTAGEGGVMWIRGGTGHLISNTVFRDNHATGDYGGAINLSSVTSARIEDSEFTRNQADLGGGAVYAFGTADLEIDNSRFEGNSAVSGTGGAIMIGGSTVSLSASQLLGNQADGQGGGLYGYGGSLSVDASQIAGNDSASSGGGIFLSEGTPLTITRSLVSDNHADPDGLGVHHGGGIYHVTGSALVISDSMISGNSASADGGGIYFGGLGASSFDRVSIQDNVAGRAGAGLHASPLQSFAVTRSSINGNQGSASGGGLWFANDASEGASLTLSETTVDGNSSSDGSAVALLADATGSSLSVLQSTFSNNTGAGFSAVTISARDGEVGPGAVTVSNSTFSGNYATAADAAVLIGPHDSMAVRYSTFADNGTDSGDSVQLQFATSATTGAAAANLSQAVFDSANTNDLRIGGSPYNAGATETITVTALQVAASNGAEVLATGAVVGGVQTQDPEIDVLADNGGYTFTHAPASATSYLVDIGSEGSRPDGNIDQRGAAKVGINTDIGAVEYTSNRPPRLNRALARALSGVKGVALSEVNLLSLISDPDGDSVSLLSVEGLPDGVSVDLGTGLVSGTPTEIGTFLVTVAVADDGLPPLTSVFRDEVTISETATRKRGGGALGWFGATILALVGLRRRSRRSLR